MNTNWFRSIKELDPAQQAFVKLPRNGRHSLTGPPGSGKTNLLLLRAGYFAGSGEKNVLLVTFTNALADFIRAGIGTSLPLSTDQVTTYHSWALEHIAQHLGRHALASGLDFNDGAR